jgi:ketosteroid isomerase-like protein
VRVPGDPEEDAVRHLAAALVVTLVAVQTAFAQSAQARKAIESASAEFSAAFAKGDAAKIAAMYTADAKAYPPGAAVVSGTAEIQKMWQGMIDSPVKSLELTTEEVEASGNFAYETGRFLLKDAGGQTVDQGKYIVVWKRDGAAWKLHRDIWNTSQPAISTAATSKP